MPEPRATYRLQLTAAFGFDAARELVPYLALLGVSHLYLSPSLEALPQSPHGYDVVDPGSVSAERGGLDGLRGLSAAAREAGLGIVLDVVPNHMALGPSNDFWADPALRERFFDLDPVSGRHRRFFDIDGLAGVRVEDPAVFEQTHALVLSLLGEGVVDGLRIDHPDGLADPAGYLAALSDRGVERVWVEKILAPDEPLRAWPVCGTVGYEFLCDACALFVDSAGEAPLTALWEEVSGDRRGFGEVACAAKLELVRGAFAPEVERLAREWPGAPAFTRSELERALASLPVYRTYVDAVAGLVDEADRAAIEASGMDPAIAAALLLDSPAPAGFVTRFQQTTPGVTAKGVEDTAFYRYARLLALNDVGGDPARFGLSVDAFHGAAIERSRRFPLGLLTTMTHDAKRSGDVRARIGALSCLPDEWGARAVRWLMRSEVLCDGGAPDVVERYFLFQTLVGAWPISSERLAEYMLKALRERKLTTSWIAPDGEWEAAMARFCQALYADGAFLRELEEFVSRVAELGQQAAVGQLVLKLTAPGVPDTYQGDELAFRALVDPDNRRPVEWARRVDALGRLAGGAAPDRSTVKLWLTWKLLGLRTRRPGPFAPGGAYEPLDAGEDCCAFVRGGDVLVVVALRGSAGALRGAPGGRWLDALRGGERSFDRLSPVAKLVDEHGVAVFEREGR